MSSVQLFPLTDANNPTNCHGVAGFGTTSAVHWVMAVVGHAKAASVKTAATLQVEARGMRVRGEKQQRSLTSRL